MQSLHTTQKRNVLPYYFQDRHRLLAPLRCGAGSRESVPLPSPKAQNRLPLASARAKELGCAAWVDPSDFLLFPQPISRSPRGRFAWRGHETSPIRGGFELKEDDYEYDVKDFH